MSSKFLIFFPQFMEIFRKIEHQPADEADSQMDQDGGDEHFWARRAEELFYFFSKQQNDKDDAGDDDAFLQFLGKNGDFFGVLFFKNCFNYFNLFLRNWRLVCRKLVYKI